jgi:Ser/Thr protein kinase RdoA (MazF antagonist)
MDLETAARVVARAGVTATPITIGSRHEGAKGSVFILGCEDGSALALKVYDSYYTERMFKEHSLYRLLEPRALPLPRVLGMNELDEEFGCAVLVMSVVDGVPLRDVLSELPQNQLLSVYRQIGAMQRELHEVTFDRFSLLIDIAADGHDDNAGLMAERTAAAIAEFRDHGGGESMAVMFERHFAVNAMLFARCKQAVLCHNDFHEANVLVDLAHGEVKISGLIDFENALAADPLFDLAKTQNHARRGSAETLAALVEGYGPMPADWRKPFALYELFHALELRNWYSAGGAGSPLPALHRRMRRLVGAPTKRDRLASMFDR